MKIVTLKQTSKKKLLILAGINRPIILSHDLTDVRNFAPRGHRFDTKYLCTEYLSFRVKVGSSYSHVTFISKLKKSKDKIILSTQKKDELVKIFQTL